ncbi:MAG: c-type cytochrome [bacterium]
MKKLTNRIIIFSAGFLIIALSISFSLVQLNDTTYETCGIDDMAFFCGTVSPKLSEKAQLGKPIFNANCAACHSVNRKMTGPALANTDSLVLVDWLSINNTKIDTTKISLLGIDYHKNSWSEFLSSEDLNHLYHYLQVDY